VLANDPDADRLGVVLKHEGQWIQMSGNDMAALARWVLAQRQDANRRAAQGIRQPAVGQALLAFSQALQDLAIPGRPPTDADLPRWAAKTLEARLHRLLRQARHACRLDAAGLHALRIRCKKLRYAQQCLQPLLSDRLDHRLEVLVNAQERLGELNDLASAQTRMLACPLPEARVWRLQLQSLQANALGALPQLQHELQHLARR